MNSGSKPLLPLLIARHRLWKSIDFEFLDIPFVLDIPTGALVVLEHACMNMKDAPMDFCDYVWDLIHSSPRLSSVEWLSDFYSFDTAPWQQLKCINFEFMVPLNDLLSSLPYCRNLEVLILGAGIYIDEESDISTLPNEPIHLPALRELMLGNIRGRFPTVASMIQAPALTTLSLYSVDPKDVNAFKFFVGNSKCVIKSFCLFSGYISPTHLLEWLDTPELSSAIDLAILIEATHIRIQPYQLCVGSTRTTMELAVDKIKEFTWIRKDHGYDQQALQYPRVETDRALRNDFGML